MSRKDQRDRRYARRVEVDGKLVAPIDNHNCFTYINWGCRCEPCRSGHAVYVAESRKRRMDRRVEIDGELVAVEARSHGSASTYINWGCRCPDCRQAMRV